jgi:hypothetical protein
VKLFVERWYPTGVAGGVTVAWTYCCPAAPDNMHDIFATSVGLAAIVVGFLATAMSIVLAAPDSKIMQELRSSGYIGELIWYLREPFLVGLALAAVALAGYFISADVAKKPAFVGALVFLSTLLIAGLFRIAMVFMHFLKAGVQKASRTK